VHNHKPGIVVRGEKDRPGVSVQAEGVSFVVIDRDQRTRGIYPDERSAELAARALVDETVLLLKPKRPSRSVPQRKKRGRGRAPKLK
jgi:hypothetical protein